MFLKLSNKISEDAISDEYITVNKSIKSNEAIEILLEKRAKEIFVVDDQTNGFLGVVTISDIIKMLNSKSSHNIPIKDIMTNNVLTIKSDVKLSECYDVMISNNVKRLPVIKNNKLIGVVRKENLVDILYENINSSNTILEYIFNNINEGICVINAEGKVVVWNRNAEKLYGVSRKIIKGKYLKDFFPNAIDVDILKTRKSVKNVYHSPKEGCHIIISASPLIVNGKLYGAVSTDKDISDMRNLYKELDKAKNKIVFLKDEMKNITFNNFQAIIGKSKEIKDKINMAKKVSKSNSTILISGESGTGKEIFAKAIYNYSGVNGCFVPINCSAIPNELFESEFFGYEMGAFTGAKKDGKVGLFELADEGVLFLDEIGEIPLFMQVKLLRVLQEKRIRRVGGEKYIDLNIRIISATNKDLGDLVKKGEFREDLYYRLNVIKIDIPPLRERGEDILLLTNYWLKELSTANNKETPKIDNEVINMLMEYDWRGNIRELINTIEHLVILCNDNIITKDLLPKHIINRICKKQINNERLKDENLDLNKSVEKLERQYIGKALELSEGSKSKAAKLLNIPRTTLHSKLERYSIG